MKIKFDFGSNKSVGIQSDKNTLRIGIYLAMLSICSLLIIMSLYFSLAGKDTTLIHAPENDSLIMPWWGWIIVLVLSSIVFVFVYRRHNSALLGWMSGDTTIRNEIDPIFPITSSAEVLAKKTAEMQDQVKFIFLIVILSFGWTLIILPFAILGVILYLISIFTSSIVVNIQADISTIIMWLLFWIIGIVLQGAFYGLFRQSEQLRTLTGDLQKLNINKLMKDPDSGERSI